MAVAAPSSIPVRSTMFILQIVLSLSLLSERQAVIMARPAGRSGYRSVTDGARSTVFQRANARTTTPKNCAMAAELVRGWGWGNEETDVRSTPIATVVAAVNSQLRVNSGQLGAEDLVRLKLARLSGDRCFRAIA